MNAHYIDSLFCVNGGYQDGIIYCQDNAVCIRAFQAIQVVARLNVDEIMTMLELAAPLLNDDDKRRIAEIIG